MLTDSVNIKDAFIINFGIVFEVIAFTTYNANDILLRCVQALTSYFSNDNMEIGKPIFINDVVCELKRVEGVRTVADIKIYNLYRESEGYSGNYYDMKYATRNEIIYPSLDPSIFEIKYPKRDIIGKVINV